LIPVQYNTNALYLIGLTELTSCEKRKYGCRDSTFNTWTLLAATTSLVAGVAKKWTGNLTLTKCKLCSLNVLFTLWIRVSDLVDASDCLFY